MERELGVGGMGCILEVINLRLNRREAMKLMMPEFAARPDAAKRFLHEARAVAGLESEHVVKVHHSGILATGEPFITMAYLRGMDLESVLIESGALPVQATVEYIRQACVGLAEAHEKGLIHRDIKPSNLFLVERVGGVRQIRVLDFGLAKTTNPLPGATVLTAVGSLVGTAPYMSPEQLSADELDARTDVWSIGVVFYQLVTGRRPFAGQGFAGMNARVMAGPPEPPSKYVPDLPPAIEAVILRCLQRDRSNRYANAGEIADALAALGPVAPGAGGCVRRPAPPLSSGDTTDKDPAPVRPHVIPVLSGATTRPEKVRIAPPGLVKPDPVVAPAIKGASPIANDPESPPDSIKPAPPSATKLAVPTPPEKARPAPVRNTILLAGLTGAGVLLGAVLMSQCGSSPSGPKQESTIAPPPSNSSPDVPTTSSSVAPVPGSEEKKRPDVAVVVSGVSLSPTRKPKCDFNKAGDEICR